MPQFDATHVMVKDCIVAWDSVTQPEAGQDGKPKYSLKVLCHPNNPDVALFNTLAQQKLAESKFAGVLPAGGRMPMGVATADEFNGAYTGWAVMNCNTHLLLTPNARAVLLSACTTASRRARRAAA